MNILNALLKQFLGAKYEDAAKSLTACLILFFAVRTAGIETEIAPSVLFLTVTVLSAAIMWQNLHSSQNADRLTGLFMLPFPGREMTFSIALAFTCCTLITKTFLALALFFAVHEWGAAVLPAAAFVRNMIFFSFLVAASLCLSVFCLLNADAYGFYRPVSAKPLIRRARGTGSIFLYLLRYLITNKSYLLNTAGLCLIAVFIPTILGQFKELNVMPLGFAVLCLNTPICTLLSCDPGLEQAVRVLPRQAGRFCSRYCFFIFSVHMTVNSVYLVIWHFRHGGTDDPAILTALLISLHSAVLSVLLEWLHPVRRWKTESDLWRHPRKYIVPVIMLLTAGLIGIWPMNRWILLCIVLTECSCLPIIARRI